MCLLMVKPKGVLIENLDDLCADATSANPDGFGAAVLVKGETKVIKGMASIKKQIECLNRIGTKPAIIHWRFGTSGSRGKVNCHPFSLADGTVFAHNGVLPIKPTNGLSDTHTLAKWAENHVELTEWLEGHVSRSNKFAVIRKGKPDIEILGEDFGEWIDGAWYSNLNWQSQSRDIDLEWAIRDLIDEYGSKKVSSKLKECVRFERSHWRFPRF